MQGDKCRIVMLTHSSSFGIKKEEDYLNRPEIRLDIPDTLKGRLVDDWENVTKNQQVCMIGGGGSRGDTTDLIYSGQ